MIIFVFFIIVVIIILLGSLVVSYDIDIVLRYLDSNKLN